MKYIFGHIYLPRPSPLENSPLMANDKQYENGSNGRNSSDALIFFLTSTLPPEGNCKNSLTRTYYKTVRKTEANVMKLQTNLKIDNKKRKREIENPNKIIFAEKIYEYNIKNSIS